MDLPATIAQQDAYLLSGVLTVIAAALVTVVILVSSRTRRRND